jgi:hypothetical protein
MATTPMSVTPRMDSVSRSVPEQDPEKCAAAFRKDHAQRIMIHPDRIAL